jgi:hypothetical protein
MGTHRQKWHSGEEVLAHFGTTWRSAQMSYIHFMQAGLPTLVLLSPPLIVAKVSQRKS